MADLAPYPPAPPNVPPDLTRPTLRYRLRVIVVLISLLLFAALYLGLVGGSAYGCYWAFAGGSGGTGRQALSHAFQTEQRVTRTYNDALKQRQSNQIDDKGFLRILEQDVLSPWRAERVSLAAVRGLPWEEQRLVDQYTKAFQLQEEAWELLAEAIRRNDHKLVEPARLKASESERVARQAYTDTHHYYQYVDSQRSDGGFWRILAGVGSGLLCLFLVKGFFKWRRAGPTNAVEITAQDQPALFAFIRRLCAETRAPLPHRIYLTPEVNACVFYNQSLLSLLVPTPKNLVIGLGLVNHLNLSEFKAVLAHEFGHFSQNSMKLGSYVYVANRVIADIVFGRDWLDHLVSGLCKVDFRIAIFAWVFVGVLWVLRTVLQGLFRVINFANSALSRQMEFNADLVAVSVTGSDALVHGLSRLDFVGEALNQARNDLAAAADHQLYSRDLFYHQARAAEYLRIVRKDPRLGEPPVLPDDPHQSVQVFQPADLSVPLMWATHPSNHDREVNAKRRYIRSPIDARSAWVLFQDAPAVREKVSQRVYAAAFPARAMTLQDPEVVQAFIDAEHAETTYHPRYHGLYDHRYLTPGALDELVSAAPAEFADTDRLAGAHARLYDDLLKDRMATHRAAQEEFQRLSVLAAPGQGKPTDFEFRGTRYRAIDAPKMRDVVKRELEQDFAWMGTLDRRVFLVHHEMARQLGDPLRSELVERYRVHLGLQVILDNLGFTDNHVRTQLAGLAGRAELTQDEFHGTVQLLQWAHDALRDNLAAASRLHLPALKNVTPGTSLDSYLISQPMLPRPSGGPNGLAGDWVGRFLQQLGEVFAKARRFHDKSLGGILVMQEQLAEQWSALREKPVPSDVKSEIRISKSETNPNIEIPSPKPTLSP
jgi:Zn-dependent protease with chaperone function